ncbi:hypothetical protein M5K25_013465 [Dendrobium thyrsiflorum]|uniref:K Homology domain-containing protein n=1 Tax=Dendrobium thyrsiflorum TaxID=117978 RepID=A0ABD0UTN2_DENTH
MADPERDHGFEFNDQGRVDVLKSPFFDINLEVDTTVEEYVDKIFYSFTIAIDDYYPSVHWQVLHRPPTPSPANFSLGAEILRVTALLGNASILDQGAIEHGRPLSTGGFFSNGAAADLNGWASTFQPERLGMIQSPSGHGWLGSPGGSSGIIIKKTIRVDIPVDKYPNYNFVGRLLGPRGNSLKRVEASTECRVLIRGRGSIKDQNREEMMRGKPGYEHLNEPLHILVDAELPMEIIDSRLIQARDILEELLKPVDESQDLIKKQQLRELAMLNGTLRDDSSQMSGSLSPFHNSLGMKRAKTRG